MDLLVLARQPDADSCESKVNGFLSKLNDANVSVQNDHQPSFAFIVDGRSLYMAMKCCRDKLRTVCENCTVVLCCRMSPIQKAEVIVIAFGTSFFFFFFFK